MELIFANEMIALYVHIIHIDVGIIAMRVRMYYVGLRIFTKSIITVNNYASVLTLPVCVHYACLIFKNKYHILVKNISSFTEHIILIRTELFRALLRNFETTTCFSHDTPSLPVFLLT